MVREKVTITNAVGLHLKPAANLCNEALKYDSEITLIKENMEINAKSVLSVLAACIRKGEEIEIICLGKDEEAAMEGILSTIHEKLDEALGNKNIIKKGYAAQVKKGD